MSSFSLLLKLFSFYRQVWTHNVFTIFLDVVINVWRELWYERYHAYTSTVQKPTRFAAVSQHLVELDFVFVHSSINTFVSSTDARYSTQTNTRRFMIIFFFTASNKIHRNNILSNCCSVYIHIINSIIYFEYVELFKINTWALTKV